MGKNNKLEIRMVLIREFVEKQWEYTVYYFEFKEVTVKL